MDWQKDEGIPKVHPTQKPVKLLERLITIFTDAGDVVIDPCAGSGSTLLAATNLNRKAYGFEIKKDFFKSANEIMFKHIESSLFA
ncbi:site-specific DNA-methyltransferase, partial [Campylobacter coli]|nr:site-specific DNA-methyltransferase [Campylobacter coli]